MVDQAHLIGAIRDSLAAIKAPRYFETERGYQGALLAELTRRLQLPDQAILEQEYQKQMEAHGLRIRPDIIIHEPFDPETHAARTEGNIAVLELKLKATAEEALQDFQKLAEMIHVLHYPVGFFINVASTLTYDELIPDDVKGRIFSFAISLEDEQARVHAMQS